MKKTEFSENIDKYKEQLYVIAYAILKNEADTEDAVCNAILKGYEHLEELKNPKSFKSWMITITKNEALHIKRKRLNLPGDEKVEEMLKPVQDNYDELWDVIQNLKEEYRLVIVLFYYNHLSLREISKVLDIPMGTVKSRLNRGRELLKNELDENESIPQPKRTGSHKRMLGLAVCIICFACVFSIGRTKVGAGVLKEFKTTILNILNVTEEEQEDLGVESNKNNTVSRPDLLVELKETVIGKQNIYALVQVTAPTDIVFSEKIGFEYFRFCKGDNYSSNQIIHGPVDCTMIEVMEGHPNKAIYLITMLPDFELTEGENVTVCLQNLMSDPFGENPELLIEGMWSNTFPISYTVVEEILLENLQGKEFTYLNEAAYVEKILITPLGMQVRCDVRNVPLAETAYSNTDYEIRLKMIDGSEPLVFSSDYEKIDEFLSKTTSTSFEGEQGTEYQQNDFEFKEIQDISKIIGIYIEDLYIPVKE